MLARKVFIVLLVMAATALAIAGKQWEANVLVTHTINQTGDTAKVYKLTTFTARDGFAYSDTIAFVDTTIVTWTSPMMVRRVAVAASIDTTKTDTLHVDLGTNKTGVAYAVANLAWTRAQYIDTIVARFNAVTTLSDTVVAQDSVTYIKLVGLIAQDGLEGDARWTLDVTNASTNLVQGDSTFTTVNMVCDSMVAAIEDSSTVADSVIAAVMGAAGGAADTAYKVTGRAGYDFLLSPNDTAQDTVLLTAAATSTSCDTAIVDVPVLMWQNGFKCLYGDAVLRASATTTGGYGTHDSAVIRLYKTNRITGSEVIVAADSGTIPKTFHISKIACDTCYGNGSLFFRIILFDTATDTSGSRNHEFNWSLTGTE
jgi:hypothetical protein